MSKKVTTITACSTDYASLKWSLDGLRIMFEADIETLLEDMCDNYCKWPTIWDDDRMGYTLADSDICKNCPLNILNKWSIEEVD